MLTLEEVQNMTFRKGGLGGYRVEEVDAFLDRVVDSLRSLERQVSELGSRVEAQDKEMQVYKEQKDSIQDALVTANATAKSIVMDASSKAEAELSASQEQSRKLVSDAEQEAQEIRTKAQEEADRLLAEAQQRADSINAETNARIEEVMNKALRDSSAQIEENNRILDAQKRSIISLMGEDYKLRSHLIQLYKEHLGVINSMTKPEDISKRQAELDEAFPPAVGHQPIPLAPVSSAKEVPVAEEPVPSDIPEENTEAAVNDTPAEVSQEAPAEEPSEAVSETTQAAPTEETVGETSGQTEEPAAGTPDKNEEPAPSAGVSDNPETPAEEEPAENAPAVSEEDAVVFASSGPVQEGVKRQPVMVADDSSSETVLFGGTKPGDASAGTQRKGGRHGKNGKKRR